jgi:hypothetical protein
MHLEDAYLSFFMRECVSTPLLRLSHLALLIPLQLPRNERFHAQERKETKAADAFKAWVERGVLAFVDASVKNKSRNDMCRKNEML